MKWLQTCLYCHNPLYQLGDGMLKCSSCKKKQSPERINKIMTLIYAFVQDENAYSASKRLKLSYVSTHRYYETFRTLCARICEDEYEEVREKPCEYEEYFYIEKSKRHKPSAVFEAQNFLTFDYDEHLYTIVMPSMKKYRQQFINDNLEDVYATEIARFKRQSRIIKVSKRYNNIVLFWDFFERSIVRYKGITQEYFPYYLKEMEFKFNHTATQQRSLLEHYYFRNL